MFSGCQFSLYPMTDEFVAVILNAVEGLQGQEDLRIETDDLSTLVVGTPERIFAAVEECFCRAAQGAGHVVLNATFSRGCPGEPDDPICRPQGPEHSSAIDIEADSVPRSGVEVAAQFALYPLGIEHYMDVIYDEIGRAKSTGPAVRGKNFCTRLDGDAHQVFAVIRAAFDRTARETGHVVITATVSKGSPTSV